MPNELSAAMSRANKDAHSWVEVEQFLRMKKFAPFYLFHGDEDFLIEEAVSTLIEEALDPSTRNFNLDVLHGAETSANDIVAIASSFPMMDDRRVVIIREFDKLPGIDLLLPIVEHPVASTCVVLICAKPDFRLKFFKTLKEIGVVLGFRQLYDNEILNWISQRIMKIGKSISPEACQLIQSYVGRSLRGLQSEIEKLLIYVGEKKVIDAEDVQSVVGMSKQYNVFELQKALGQKDMKHSMEILERMINAGESPIYIVVMLTRYFQKLALVQELSSEGHSDARLASEIGVSTFFVKEYIAAAKRFPSSHIELSFTALVNADEALKSSGMDERLAMTLLLYQLLRTEQVGVARA